jgi:gluconokinase
MDYYLAIDIGTTATKTVAFSETGECLAIQSISYPIIHPEAGWSEQEPSEILQAVINGINTVIKALDQHKIICVSFSSVMHSLIAVDVNGKPLTRTIIWADNRAQEIAKDLRQSETGRNFYQLTGVPVHAMTPLCKLLWMKESEKEIYSKAYRFIGIKEYIFQQLFNESIIDTSVASATGLLNIKSLQWDEFILKYLNLDIAKLSSLVSPTYIMHFTKQDERLCLPINTPVVIGGSDGACANLGCGAIDSTTLAITIGTSSAARMIVRQPYIDDNMRTFCYHVNRDQYIVGGGSNSGGVVLQWLKEKLFDSGEDYDELFELAKSVAAGCDGLICLPYILGERAPVWDAAAKGVFLGFTIQHTKAHFTRAAIEGVVFNLLTIAKAIPGAENIQRISVSGGLTNSAVVSQILADVFNKTIVPERTSESSAWGAVLLAMEALGKVREMPDSNIKDILPNQENHIKLKKAYEKFVHLYTVLKDSNPLI